MHTIIAGSRTAARQNVIDALESCPFEITEVLSGKAPGADTHGENWADAAGIPVDPHPADWDNIDAPGAVIRYRNGKPYNAVAGHWRNQEMADCADALLLVWDGKSPGSRDMLNRAKRKGLRIHIHIFTPNKDQQHGLFAIATT